MQLVVNGIIIGSIYALGAIGLTLSYGILRFANFAQGDLMTLGAYACLLFLTLGLPPPLAFLLALAAAAGAALAADRLLYRPLRRRGSIVLLVSSVGAALFLRNLVQLIWGPQMRYYSSKIEVAWQGPGGVMIKPTQVLIVILALSLMALTHLFLARTRMGKAMRATADNMDLAQVSGIDTERVILWTWVMGGALAAAAGILMGLEIQLRPVMGWDMLLPVFAAAILGGVGRPYGAMAGGVLIGLVQEGSMALPFLEPTYKSAVSFVVMIAVLLVRPQGLFGRRERWS